LTTIHTPPFYNKNIKMPTTYTVVAGDTPYLIDKSHNDSLKNLINANPQLNGSTDLSVGETLTLPHQGQTSSTYVVLAGDSLYLIAKAQNVSLGGLIAANPQLNGSANLSIDQELHLPGQPQAPINNTSGAYAVVAGDTPYLIAKAQNVSLDALVAANPQLNGSTNLSVSQELHIPGQAQTPGTGNYSVAAGDTLYLIVKAHGISLDALIAANPRLKRSTNLSVGEGLTISSQSSQPSQPAGNTSGSDQDNTFAIHNQGLPSLPQTITSPNLHPHQPAKTPVSTASNGPPRSGTSTSPTKPPNGPTTSSA
jgi:LysM repeat protein